MIRKCFDTEIQLNVIEIDNSNYINCYERGNTVYLTPEEEVRQSVLIYFYKHSIVDMSKFHSKVEFQSMDLVLYKKIPIPDFQPTQTPIFIFEFKRDYTNITEYEYQLIGYMERFNCTSGALTNSKDIVIIQNVNSDFISINCNISELEVLFQNLEIDNDKDINDFVLAQGGDYNSFINLTKKYGRTSKFIVTCKEYPAPINCFFFNIYDEFVFFDICGVYTKKKQHKFHKSSFIRLDKIYE